MTPLLDVHTHTVASGHAYSTLQEMAREAADKGLEVLGITEHGPMVDGTCRPIYFRSYPVIPRELYGVRLLMGCELNIHSPQGDVDLDESYLKFSDLRTAGIHRDCWVGATKAENTSAVLGALDNPWVHIIVHPGDGTAELDFEALVLEAKRQRKLLELNNHSLKPWRHKDIAPVNNAELLRLCRKHDLPVVIGSDAHICYDIANFSYALSLIEEVGFPQELILNDKPQDFIDYLKIENSIDKL